MEKEAIQSKASELYNWIQDAVGDIAHDAMLYPEPDVKKKIAKAKRSGVSDLEGWYADELYNDSDTLSDLTGDRLYDAAEGKTLKERYRNMILIAETMKERSHKALEKALNEHIKNWKAFVKKLNK